MAEVGLTSRSHGGSSSTKTRRKRVAKRQRPAMEVESVPGEEEAGAWTGAMAGRSRGVGWRAAWTDGEERHGLLDGAGGLCERVERSRTLCLGDG